MTWCFKKIKVILENLLAFNFKIPGICQYKAKQKGKVRVSYSLGSTEAAIHLCIRGGMVPFTAKNKMS